MCHPFALQATEGRQVPVLPIVISETCLPAIALRATAGHLNPEYVPLKFRLPKGPLNHFSYLRYEMTEDRVQHSALSICLLSSVI